MDDLDDVTISKARYEELLDIEERLNALENAGVDSWDGFDDAMAELRDEG